MKIISIFVKTLKTISRNWKYFFALFLFPLLLIFVAGGILNSINVDNVRVGFVFDSPRFQNVDFMETNYRVYPDLQICLNQLSSGSLGICIYFYEDGLETKINVYHGGTNKIVEQYARNIILEEVSNKQDILLMETSERIEENLEFYKKLFLDTRTKLMDTKAELILEKENLIERKQEVEQIREDYLQIYYPLKESEVDFLNFKNKVESNQEDMEDSLSIIKSISSNMNYYLDNLREAPLTESQQGYINEIESYVSEVNNFISLYEETYNYDELKNILDNVELIYLKLDTIKNVLDNTIVDLERSIEKMDEIILSIGFYLKDLEGYMQGLYDFKEESEYKGIKWQIISLSSSDNPILLSFPLLVSIIIMFTSVILSNMSSSKQIHEKSYFREMITPVKKRKFLFSNYLVNLFFVLIQIIVLVFMGLFFIGIPSESIFSFILGSLLISSIFIFIGSSISYLVRQKSLSSLISIFVLIFSFVISSVIAPSILINRELQQIMGLNPFVIFNNFLEAIFISQLSFEQVSGFLFKMLIFFFIFGIVLIYSRIRHDKKIGA